MSDGKWRYIVDCWVTPGVLAARSECVTFGAALSYVEKYAIRYRDGEIRVVHESCDEGSTGLLDDESEAVEAVVRAARARLAGAERTATK